MKTKRKTIKGSSLAPYTISEYKKIKHGYDEVLYVRAKSGYVYPIVKNKRWTSGGRKPIFSTHKIYKSGGSRILSRSTQKYMINFLLNDTVIDKPGHLF